MKLQNNFKLPRKIKKELKKGFRKIIKPLLLSQMQMIESGFMVSTRITYSGSNTKSFRRLCKYARKEEKRMYEKMAKDTIESMNYDPNDGLEDMLLGRRPPKDNKIIAVFPLKNKTIAGTQEY